MNGVGIFKPRYLISTQIKIVIRELTISIAKTNSINKCVDLNTHFSKDIKIQQVYGKMPNITNTHQWECKLSLLNERLTTPVRMATIKSQK